MICQLSHHWNKILNTHNLIEKRLLGLTVSVGSVQGRIGVVKGSWWRKDAQSMAARKQREQVGGRDKKAPFRVMSSVNHLLLGPSPNSIFRY